MPVKRTAKGVAKAQPRRRTQIVAQSPGSDEAPDNPEMLLVGFDPDRPSSISPDQVIVDRDALRELRMSPAAIEVAAKAKGEDTLAEIRSHKGGSKHIHMVNPYDLHFEDDYNPRDFTTPFMRQRVAAYADSIAVRGVRKPLDVYVKADRLLVNGGETRWRATLHALNFLNRSIERIQCIIVQNEDDTDRKIGQWLDNDTLRFEPMAEAKLFRDYLDLGGEIALFARRIGHPQSYILQRTRLLEMPKWLQRKVEEGTVPHRVAYQNIWLASGENQEIAKELLAASLTTAQAEQAERAGNESAPTVIRPRHVEAAAENSAVSTKIVRLKFPDRLATLLKHHGRDQWVQWLGAELAGQMFKLANMRDDK